MRNKTLLFKPVTALLTGALIISFSSVLVRISNVPPTISAFYRVFFGSIFLICVCLVRKEFRKRSLRNNLLAVLCGFFFALDLWSWHMSIQYVGPGLATILANFQVFVLSVVGIWVFKEKLSLLFIISVPLAFLGLFLIIGIDIDHLSRNYLTGVLYGIATAIFYSMFLLLLRHLQSDNTNFSLFYYLMLLSVACSVFLGGKAYYYNEPFAILDGTTLLSLVTLGLFNQTIAWVMIANALPKVKASHAGLILLLQPALSFVWDVAFFNRPTGIFGWTGVIVVLAAIYFGMSSKEGHS